MCLSLYFAHVPVRRVPRVEGKTISRHLELIFLVSWLRSFNYIYTLSNQEYTLKRQFRRLLINLLKYKSKLEILPLKLFSRYSNQWIKKKKKVRITHSLRQKRRERKKRWLGVTIKRVPGWAWGTIKCRSQTRQESKGDKGGTHDIKELENVSFEPKKTRVLKRKEQASRSNSAESLNNMIVEMWPLALTLIIEIIMISTRAEREVEWKDLEYMGENERLGNRSGCRKFDKEMGR